MKLEQLTDKYLEEFRQMYQDYQKEMKEEFSEETFQKQVSYEKQEILLIFVEKDLIGFAIWQQQWYDKEISEFLGVHDEEYSLLDDFYIMPKFRGRGYGKEFLRNFEPYAKDKGATLMIFGTTVDNIPAIRVYTKSGYNSKRGFYDEDGENFIYWKRLK